MDAFACPLPVRRPQTFFARSFQIPKDAFTYVKNSIVHIPHQRSYHFDPQPRPNPLLP